MYQQATQAYQKTATTATDPRALEAELLMKAAARLTLLRNNWEETSIDERSDILTYNRTAWTLLATEATAEESELPLEIQNNIANLALFTFNQTMELLAAENGEELETLININKAIAAGLRGQTESPVSE
ncbi:flagellar biosynthesis regulator FlaF [Polycladidibacter hongkongensis]|uniref:flagellar biosynthesis regulator FlaF n=1 Tax=Polycladidibacter hongkongensis TaxID=1647556 RepID=UPI0009EAF555|nr:flagellar biosynthesis regulator FlaF [Pseudovibrio hongkongensis]